ncbi:hypothetical protein LJC22_03515 [Desulfosarcina sp. OttesenSCG-928-G10]|nr:hypothetical protein [Desulfosarcina sp. OttesenSCG-928-G10]
MNYRLTSVFFAVLLIFSLSGCGSMRHSGTESQTQEPAAAEEAYNPIPNPIPPKSKFAKIQIGWSQARVHDTIGKPTDSHGYTTGQAWNPFYFGGDRYRIEDLYKGEGRVVYANDGGPYSQHYVVAEIIYDPKESGYSDAVK